jgi:hypothetical protein
MAKQSSWSNNDGLVVRFGARTVETSPAVTATEGVEKQLTLTFGPGVGLQTIGTGNLTAAQKATEDFVNAPVIPQGARITGVRWWVSGGDITGGITNATLEFYQSKAAANPGNRVSAASAGFGGTFTNGTLVTSAPSSGTSAVVSTPGGCVLGLNTTGAVISGGNLNVVVSYVVKA